MSEVTQPCGETLSIGQALRVNGACERFEAAWEAGDRPRIEDVLVGVADGQERRTLLRELIALELELRREAGERPDEDEYRGRFADDAEVVDAVFCGARARGDRRLRAARRARPRRHGRRLPGPAGECSTAWWR